jgi:acyl-CoA synthetase (AMP-forming)/AMP-acid ligase II
VLTTHSRIVENVLSTLANQLHDATSDSRYLIATPLTHMAIGYVWPMIAVGGTCVVLGDFTAESFCDVAIDSGATHTLMVPTMIALVADHVDSNPEIKERLANSALSAVWYAGSPIPQATFEKAWRALGPVLNQQYGLTELWTAHRSMCATMLRADKALAKQGSCGQPMTGTELAVFDDDRHRLPALAHGEIAIRSSGHVLGYLNDPGATAATFSEGWTWTGDIGYLDEDGFLFIADRKKDMIISGGLNIYSAELESALSTHPYVRQCAAVGAPDPKWGETPWMYVVLGQTPTTEEELRAHVRERLGGYKAPSRIIIVDELPLGPTGKILKRALRERVKADLLEDAAPELTASS